MTPAHGAFDELHRTAALFTPARLHELVDEASVAVIGSSVPSELIRAAGMKPLRLPPLVAATPLADRHLSSSTEPWIAAAYEILRTIGRGHIRRVIVANEGDSSRRLYFHLATLRQKDHTLPEVHFVDTQRQRRASSEAYTRTEIAALVTRLSEWAGHGMDESDVHAEIITGRRQRAALRELFGLRHRRDVRFGGVDALAAVAAAEVLDPDAHTDLLERVGAEVAVMPAREGFAVFVTGSPIADPRIYSAVEETGAIVVGEDHDWGAGWAQLEVGMEGDPVHALSDAYRVQRGTGACVPDIADRVRTVMAGVERTGAQGLLGVELAGDLSPAWEWPDQARALADRGVPTVWAGSVSAEDPASASTAAALLCTRVAEMV